MIEFAQQKDIEEIKRLWHTVFGDSKEDIGDYLAKYLDCVLLYRKDRRVVGMLSMLSVSLKEKKGRYIYAVATDEDARGKGISTKLLEYANRYIKENGECFSLLVPAQASLFEFYGKRGYKPVYSVRQIEHEKEGFGSSDLEVKKISPEKLFLMRRRYFADRNFVEWSVDELEYIWRMYNGGFFEIKGKKAPAFAVCTFNGGMLDIKELCCHEEETNECINALNSFFDAPHCRAALPGRGKAPSAMIYPKDFDDVYFNLAMD